MRLLAALLIGSLPSLAWADSPTRPKVIESGKFTFTPIDDQRDTPKRYQLATGEYRYEMEKKRDLPAIDVSIYHLTFPSPVKTTPVENNTVHAEYYRPTGKGPFPAVIVLDITAGNQMLSRHLATHFAANGIAGLFVQMAHYGPRRPAGSKIRLMSPNLKQTTAGVTQTVLDLRVAAAWLASRPEIDPKQLGIMGTSLGSFIAALTGEMEPRLHRVGVLLGGGGFVKGYAGHPLAKPYVAIWEAFGGNLDGLEKKFEPIDPLTCAANLRKRDLLILAASRDEVVPPAMARMLWEAAGKQKIAWYDATHYSAAFHIADAMERLVDHFRAR
jgi:dienelactone hydrolase